MNVAAFALFFALVGISSLVSSLSNDEKEDHGISGMIIFGFFSLDFIRKISDKVNWLRCFTIFTLYKPSEVVVGKGNSTQGCAILFAIGLIAFIISILTFKKRNFPL